MSTDCLFCKIVAGEIPSRKVYEDEWIYAFLDIFPASKGHTLVIPKKHAADIFEISHASYSQVAQGAHHVATLLQERLACEGITILQANREAGWQTVFHLHMHVIPRWIGDSLHKPWEIAAADEDQLDAVLREITQ